MIHKSKIRWFLLQLEIFFVIFSFYVVDFLKAVFILVGNPYFMKNSKIFRIKSETPRYAKFIEEE